MENIVLWVALIGVIGTLGGVCLGNWLQSRNIKRQRDWMLQDQKREWVRRQKQEKFERILACVDGALQYILKAKWIAKFSSTDKMEELFLKYVEQAVPVWSLSFTVRNEDKELADLLAEFFRGLDGTGDIIIKDRSFDISEKEQYLSELAGQIKQRINKLLEETFD
jgi:hypothetical protein